MIQKHQITPLHTPPQYRAGAVIAYHIHTPPGYDTAPRRRPNAAKKGGGGGVDRGKVRPCSLSTGLCPPYELEIERKRESVCEGEVAVDVYSVDDAETSGPAFPKPGEGQVSLPPKMLRPNSV